MNELPDNQADAPAEQVQATWTPIQKLIAIAFSLAVIIVPLYTNRKILLSYASPLITRGSYLGR
jgi:hypothetical protein